jgi:hypothetical protein
LEFTMNKRHNGARAMTVNPFADAYLPAVSASRSLASRRVGDIAFQLDTPAHTLGFLLSFLAVRIGPLQSIPAWLRLSAGLVEREHPEIAQDLREAAELERLHRRALIEDLAELSLLVDGVDTHELIRRPFDPRIERHSKIRALVPTRTDPLVALAIDLELAALGQELGPALIAAGRRALGPGIRARRFIHIRTEETARRIQARVARLEPLLAEHPERAAGWARVAVEVTQSYLDTLDACVEYGRSLAPRLSGAAPIAAARS